MSNYDCAKDLMYDQRITVNELSSQVRELREQLNTALCKGYDYRMQLVFAKQHLRERNLAKAPTIVSEGDDSTDPQYYEPAEYECSECCVQLERDWTFCPGCGCWIDWDYASKQEDEGYAYDVYRDEQMELERLTACDVA